MELQTMANVENSVGKKSGTGSGISSSPFLNTDLNKKISVFLAEEGILLSALFMPDPLQLSLIWGAGLTLTGLAILIWEHGYKEKPPIIAGPYRFVRNPNTLAYWLLSFGLAIAARSFPAVILVLLLLPWLFYIELESIKARPDTRLLRYRFHVPALIPTLLPYEKSANEGFSWRRAVRIKSWPQHSRLLSLSLGWAYLLVSFELKLPWWGGLIAAMAYVLIKAFLSQRKFLQFSFRKNVKISAKPS
ncbi:MAG: hypothetical protein EOP07_06645 [Proteobacteria bacterium]|nr:MAG: hypothetical protein EOP07_06645 [Pseudomonadota bacterium]